MSALVLKQETLLKFILIHSAKYGNLSACVWSMSSTGVKIVLSEISLQG